MFIQPVISSKWWINQLQGQVCKTDARPSSLLHWTFWGPIQGPSFDLCFHSATPMHQRSFSLGQRTCLYVFVLHLPISAWKDQNIVTRPTSRSCFYYLKWRHWKHNCLELLLAPRNNQCKSICNLTLKGIACRGQILRTSNTWHVFYATKLSSIK